MFFFAPPSRCCSCFIWLSLLLRRRSLNHIRSGELSPRSIHNTAAELHYCQFYSLSWKRDFFLFYFFCHHDYPGSLLSLYFFLSLALFLTSTEFPSPSSLFPITSILSPGRHTTNLHLYSRRKPFIPTSSLLCRQLLPPPPLLPSLKASFFFLFSHFLHKPPGLASPPAVSVGR